MVYKRNFLNNVIFRIDFDKIELGRLSSFLEKIEKDFPIVEKEREDDGTLNVNLKTKEVKRLSKPLTSWNVYSKNRNTKFKILSDILTIEHFKYKDSKALLSNVGIVSDFLKEFKIKTINRIGLRYVNEIKNEGRKPLEWSKYINGNLLGSINFVIKNKKTMTRAMNYIIFKEEFGDVRIDYGIWNPSYPSPVSKGNFILDIDVRSKFPLDVGGVNLENITKEYGQNITKLFEKAIKKDLREILNK